MPVRWGNIIPNLESKIELLSEEKSERGRKSNQISGVPINHLNHHFYNRPLAFIHTIELLLEVRQQCQRHSPIHWHNINLLPWLETNILYDPALGLLGVKFSPMQRASIYIFSQRFAVLCVPHTYPLILLWKESHAADPLDAVITWSEAHV